MIHTKLYLRKTYLKSSGECSVFLRINQGNKVNEVSLNISTKENCWNDSRRRITAKDPQHTNKNKLLFHFENKAASIILDHTVKNKNLSVPEFIRLFKDLNYGNESFFAYAEKVIEEKRGISQPDSIKVMNDQVNKLKAFRSEILINEVDLTFILAYEKFLIVTRKNNENTVSKSMRFLSQVMNHAFKNGIIEKNPFVNYKIKRVEGDRAHLTESEVNKLVEIYQGTTLKPNKANVLRYFLFSCYTGLAYVDVKDLRKRDIISIQSGGSFIRMIDTTRKKTGTAVRVPLLPEAELLLPDKLQYEGQKVFKVLSDQPTNRYLKEIMTLAGINKTISFHCSRHTFATIANTKGINYDIIAKYLGHTDVKTTKIYAKFENELLISEMGKWK